MPGGYKGIEGVDQAWVCSSTWYCMPSTRCTHPTPTRYYPFYYSTTCTDIHNINSHIVTEPFPVNTFIVIEYIFISTHLISYPCTGIE